MHILASEGCLGLLLTLEQVYLSRHQGGKLGMMGESRDQVESLYRITNNIRLLVKNLSST